MGNLLIRDVPEPDVQAIDRHADRLGLSRAEYLRRLIRQDSQRSAAPVTRQDLLRFSDQFSDLADADVLRDAWS
jgi:hypothetical protein